MSGACDQVARWVMDCQDSSRSLALGYCEAHFFNVEGAMIRNVDKLSSIDIFVNFR